MKEFHVRLGQPSDRAQLAQLRHALWPESSTEDHGQELDLILAGKAPGILPAAIFVTESDGDVLLGFLEAGLRSHADGCDPSHPTGYVEGWYVVETHRRQGIGAAIPFNLLESEIFGHEKGAFTGAIAQRVGRFEMADKGTLFLDEVGDLPLALQPKLLRVLQEQEFERLGSSRTHRADVRIVTATHRDLRTW